MEAKEKKNIDMTKGPIAKALFSFTIPILIGNIFQQFYAIADTIIVGRTLGSNALAAVGSTGTINFLVLGFALGIASGFAVVTSQKFGAEDEKGIRQSVSNGIMLLVLICAVMTAVSTLSMRKILIIMNTPDDIFMGAYTYIMIICAGLTATVFYNLFAGFLRAVGNSRVPLYFLLLSSALNIILDLVFIICFSWGIAGAAIATVFSQLVSAIGSLIYIVLKEKILVPRKEEWRLQRDIANVQLYIGVPMALQYAITASGTMVMQSAINIFGSVAVASFSAGAKCSSLFTSVFNSIGQSIPTFVGQNYGKGDLNRINKGVKVASIFTVVYGILAGILVVVLLPYEIRLFVADASEVASMLPWAKIYLIESALFYVPLGFIFIYRNSMQAYGSSMAALIAGVVEMVTRVVCAIIAMITQNYAVAVFCDSAAWFTGAVYVVIAYIFAMRKLRSTMPEATAENIK